jgi:OPT family oligopeptide transporter
LRVVVIDPFVHISLLLAQVMAFPMGRFLAWILPTTRFTTFGYSWTLNPGPFNVKEHTLVTTMAGIVEYGAYATDFLVAQDMYYNLKFGFCYEIMFLLGSQLMGFYMAGVIRKFVVWPANMIWPGKLVNAALFNAMHQNYTEDEKKKHMSRDKFFVIVALCSFIWYFFPGYLWTGLSVFSWVCWIAPKNVTVNALFGYTSGLGMGVLTFDWAMISMLGSPLVYPVCVLSRSVSNLLMSN